MSLHSDRTLEEVEISSGGSTATPPTLEDKGMDSQSKTRAGVLESACSALLQGPFLSGADDAPEGGADGSDEVDDMRWSCEPIVREHPCVHRLLQVMGQFWTNFH